MITRIRKVVAFKINLSTLPLDILKARQECCLAYAHTMYWMANHYKSLGIIDGMKSCARRGIDSIKEYQRICRYLKEDETKTVVIKDVA